MNVARNHSETVEHFILHCPKYDSERLQLTDTVESLRHEVKDDGYAFDKLHFVVAPKRDDIVTINTRSSITCLTYVFRHALQKG